MNHQLKRVAKVLYRRLGTPVSMLCEERIEAGQYAALQEMRVDPNAYTEAAAYHRDVIAVDFLRKLALPGDAERKYRAAVQAFRDCEARNFKTNRRLFTLIDSASSGDERIDELVARWRKEVRKVLGRLPMGLSPRFSGGATMSDKFGVTTLPDKITSSPTYYGQTTCLLPLWEETAWARSLRERRVSPRQVRFNAFFTVPKDFEKDRGCAKEASLSLSYQLAVGREIRKRINRVYSVDLENLQHIHRAKAQHASIFGREATIDLSNASNCVTRGLVELVFPEDWFLLVDSLRAPSMRIDGQILRLEMFSSMGNGYTFELETLLFWTLARALCSMTDLEELRSVISCVGDDIICPVELAEDLIAALRYFGFEPNARKTYVTGPFRESCGGDFFRGQPVRGVFVEEEPTEPQHWISLANQLWRLGELGSSARMECLKNIPSDIRSCVGPEALGDIVIHGPTQHHAFAVRRPRGEEEPVIMYRCYRPVPLVLPWTHWWPSVQMASALAGAESAGVTPRNGVSGYRLGWVTEPGSSWLPT